jgi:hypothetical protein
MDDQDRPERVTVRIQEDGAKPPGAESFAPESETKVVFVRDTVGMSAAYYRGFHDGGAGAKWTVLLLSMAIVLLSSLLVKHASE